MSDHYCYVGLFKNHVNLGFYYGSSLEDPTGLLEGSGKNLRHAKIIRPDELDSPELKALVTQASRYLPNRKD